MKANVNLPPRFSAMLMRLEEGRSQKYNRRGQSKNKKEILKKSHKNLN